MITWSNNGYVHTAYINGEQVGVVVRRGNKNYQWIVGNDMGFESTIRACKQKILSVLKGII